MSLKEKLDAARHLSTILKKWPDDSKKVYASFRNAQLKLLDSDVPSTLPSAATLRARADAASVLLSNTYKTKYDIGSRLSRPDGNPLYYELIAKEVYNQQRKRRGVLQTLKESMGSWWSKRK